MKSLTDYEERIVYYKAATAFKYVYGFLAHDADVDEPMALICAMKAALTVRRTLADYFKSENSR
jgi:hypothetical protein